MIVKSTDCLYFYICAAPVGIVSMALDRTTDSPANKTFVRDVRWDVSEDNHFGLKLQRIATYFARDIVYSLLHNLIAVINM